jgi:hypothetical protein
MPTACGLTALAQVLKFVGLARDNFDPTKNGWRIERPNDIENNFGLRLIRGVS